MFYFTATGDEVILTNIVLILYYRFVFCTSIKPIKYKIKAIK